MLRAIILQTTFEDAVILLHCTKWEKKSKTARETESDRIKGESVQLQEGRDDTQRAEKVQ